MITFLKMPAGKRGAAGHDRQPTISVFYQHVTLSHLKKVAFVSKIADTHFPPESENAARQLLLDDFTGQGAACGMRSTTTLPMLDAVRLWL